MHACTFSSPTQTSPPDESNSMDLTPADTLALPPYTTSDKKHNMWATYNYY